MNSSEKKQVEKRIAKLIQRGRFRGKTIVLFGASPDSLHIFKVLADNGVRVDVLVDNDRRKKGNVYFGLRVGNPYEILHSYDRRFAILFYSKAYSGSMINELLQYGYQMHENIFCLSTVDNESLGVFLREFARCLRGFVYYGRIMKNRPPDSVAFVMPYSGLGDVYLAGTFFSQYLSQKSIRNYVFIVVNEACRQVAEMFSIGNVIVRPQSMVNDIIACQRFAHSDWPLVVLNDAWTESYTNTIGGIRGYKNLNFDKMFRYFVFDLTDDARHCIPPLPPFNDFVDGFFEANGLVAGKTVILAPYSNTLFRFPTEIWEEIAAKCIEKGYTVCTNCANERETAVAGTIPVFLPINQMVPVLNRAGCFVGARSGLCDVISAAECIKIILYDKDYVFHQASSFEYFSLNAMGLCKDAIEFELGVDSYEGVLNEILESIYFTNVD